MYRQVKQDGKTIKEVAKEVGINYSTAKYIMKQLEREVVSEHRDEEE